MTRKPGEVWKDLKKTYKHRDPPTTLKGRGYRAEEEANYYRKLSDFLSWGGLAGLTITYVNAKGGEVNPLAIESGAVSLGIFAAREEVLRRLDNLRRESAIILLQLSTPSMLAKKTEIGGLPGYILETGQEPAPDVPLQPAVQEAIAQQAAAEPELIAIHEELGHLAGYHLVPKPKDNDPPPLLNNWPYGDIASE